MISLPSNVPDGVVLEGLLQRACEDAAWRPAFCRKLLDSDVIVILPDEERMKGVARPDRIHLVQWKRIDGSAAIPFFSSARTFFEAVPQGAKCLVLDVVQLFTITRGALLHLNPYNEFNVELPPSEVEALLSAGSPAVVEGFTLASDRDLSFRKVDDPPGLLLNALTTLYSQLPQVKAAYLAQIRGLYDDARESLLLGLDVDGDPEAVVRDTALVVDETYSGPLDLDIVHIGAGGLDLLHSGFEPAFRFFDRRMASVLVAPEAVRSSQ